MVPRWQRRLERSGAALAVLLATLAVRAPLLAQPAFSNNPEYRAIDKAVRATCKKRIVMLGEASHSDGHSDSVKVELIERLVTQCHFSAVLFEASTYEFVPVARAHAEGRSVSADDIATAVGGLWKFDQEVRPLFGFLADHVNTGQVTVGGLDFQAGGFQQPYSNEGMLAELTARLGDDRRAFCRAVYAAQVIGSDPPAGVTVQGVPVALRTCLAEIHKAFAGSEPDDTAVELRNLDAWVASSDRGFGSLVLARDAMMFGNAATIFETLGAKAKIVIWTHNAHAARNSTMLKDYPGGADTLGSALARRYGPNLFSLGITARGGSFRWSGSENKTVPAAEPGMLEAFSDRTGPAATIFVDHQSLQRLGNIPAGFIFHTNITANWSTAYDGVLLLDAEHPPHSTRTN